MPVRYFAKLTPATNVPLSNGGAVKFSTVDGLRGFFQTDNQYFIDEFLRCMRENRSCITEITQAEYESEYLEKKSQGISLKPIWREEMHKGSPTDDGLLGRLGVQRVQAVVGVSKGPPAKIALTVESPPPDSPAPTNGVPRPGEPKQPFDVKVGKRKKATNPKP